MAYKTFIIKLTKLMNEPRKITCQVFEKYWRSSGKEYENHSESLLFGDFFFQVQVKV